MNTDDPRYIQVAGMVVLKMLRDSSVQFTHAEFAKIGGMISHFQYN